MASIFFAAAASRATVSGSRFAAVRPGTLYTHTGSGSTSRPARGKCWNCPPASACCLIRIGRKHRRHTRHALQASSQPHQRPRRVMRAAGPHRNPPRKPRQSPDAPRAATRPRPESPPRHVEPHATIKSMPDSNLHQSTSDQNAGSSIDPSALRWRHNCGTAANRFHDRSGLSTARCSQRVQIVGSLNVRASVEEVPGFSAAHKPRKMPLRALAPEGNIFTN